jgi:hypothetical protein
MTRIAAALLIMLALPSTANALTPTSPAPDHRQTSPLFEFQWANDEADIAQRINIHTTSSTEPSGQLAAESEIYTYGFSIIEESHAPLQGFAADQYWWQIKYATDGWGAPPYSYTTPRLVTVVPRVTTPSLNLDQYDYSSRLVIRTAWKSNTRSVRVVCRVHRNGSLVSSATVWDSSVSLFVTNRARCVLRVPERYDGDRLRVSVIVTGVGKSSGYSRLYTAR